MIGSGLIFFGGSGFIFFRLISVYKRLILELKAGQELLLISVIAKSLWPMPTRQKMLLSVITFTGPFIRLTH